MTLNIRKHCSSSKTPVKQQYIIMKTKHVSWQSMNESRNVSIYEKKSVDKNLIYSADIRDQAQTNFLIYRSSG